MAVPFKGTFRNSGERSKQTLNLIYLLSVCFYSTSTSGAKRLKKNRNKYFKLNITRLRIPSGRRQTSWLFYKRGQGVELGSIVKQIQLVVRAGLELETSGF